MANKQQKNMKPEHNAESFPLENLHLLEKTLERNSQAAIEPLNVLEQLLVGIVDRMSQQTQEMKSKFILRRLPTYLAPHVNENEYAVLLQNFEFSLSIPTNEPMETTTDRYLAATSLTHTEVFQKISLDSARNSPTNGLTNDYGAFYSHETFKQFASSFVDAFEAECHGNDADEKTYTSQNPVGPNNFNYSGEIQLMGAHLAQEITSLTHIEKIFKMNQPPLTFPKHVREKVCVKVSYKKSFVTLEYKDVIATIRPALFNANGHPRVNSNVLQRMPLYSPMYLPFANAMSKLKSTGQGFLMFPTNMETIWSCAIWPGESHLISLFHPSSILTRILKIYGYFCRQPKQFWEIVYGSEYHDDDLHVEMFEDQEEMRTLPLEFLMSSFFYEIQRFPKVEDWSPTLMNTRLQSLFKGAVNDFNNGFHMDYFTRTNSLRGLWKQLSNDRLNKKTKFFEDMDDMTESNENLDDYGEKAIMEMNDLDDDFGFYFDELDTIDNESYCSNRPDASTIYKSLTRDKYPAPSSSVKGHKNLRPSTLSKILGSKVAKKLTWNHGGSSSSGNARKNLSMDDIALEFEESIAHRRKANTVCLRLRNAHESVCESSFFGEGNNLQKLKEVNEERTKEGRVKHFTQDRINGCQNRLIDPPFCIYASILEKLLNMRFKSPNISENHEFGTKFSELENEMKNMEAQDELISVWLKACQNIPRHKLICPHVFSRRQLLYLAKIVQSTSRNFDGKDVVSSRIARPSAWEMSGNVLRSVLQHMRNEISESDTTREKLLLASKQHEKKSSETIRRKRRTMSMCHSFNFWQKSSFSRQQCSHGKNDFSTTNLALELESYTTVALEEPEISATRRLLEWLWSLRCSDVGKLSVKSQSYLEELYNGSLIGAHFLECIDEETKLQKLALQSAIAVTNIMQFERFPIETPLVVATAKGWLWAEMILSLAKWNTDKGIHLQVTVTDPNNPPTFITRNFKGDNEVVNQLQLQSFKSFNDRTQTTGEGLISEPDIDAATLAFHSERATPIGWNDFEDPRRPGPYAAAIMVLSMKYFKLWEVIPTNVVQVMVRLQKFSSLQHVGNMLQPPHRKTALKEVRKLNKSLSVRVHSFDDNVMSKTFRRLASLRTTRSKMLRDSQKQLHSGSTIARHSCAVVGCKTISSSGFTSITIFRGKQLQCTRL